MNGGRKAKPKQGSHLSVRVRGRGHQDGIKVTTHRGVKARRTARRGQAGTWKPDPQSGRPIRSVVGGGATKETREKDGQKGGGRRREQLTYRDDTPKLLSLELR